MMDAKTEINKKKYSLRAENLLYSDHPESFWSFWNSDDTMYIEAIYS